jgi:hypothetical protein
LIGFGRGATCSTKLQFRSTTISTQPTTHPKLSIFPALLEEGTLKNKAVLKEGPAVFSPGLPRNRLAFATCRYKMDRYGCSPFSRITRKITRWIEAPSCSE